MTGQWAQLGKAWLGDGVTDGPVRVEGRVQWAEPEAAVASTETQR